MSLSMQTVPSPHPTQSDMEGNNLPPIRYNSTAEILLPVASGRYRCEICERTYSRRDHLARHRQTHTSRRPFTCSSCGKDFARRDLFMRHSAIHVRDYAPNTLPNRAQYLYSRRVSRACKACADAKVKCHDEKPCRRCLKRGTPCTPTSGGFGPAMLFNQRPEVHSENEQADFSLEPNSVRDRVCHGSGFPAVMNYSFSTRAETRLTTITEEAMLDYARITDWPADESTQLTRTVEGLSSSLDPDKELPLETSFDDFLLSNFESASGWEELIPEGRIRRASEAYQSSLWYSHPNQTSKRTESIGRDLSSQPTDAILEGLFDELCSLSPRRFSQSIRDNLFAALVIQAHKQTPDCLQNICAVFPSPALLDALVHSFFAKQDQKVDAWIHAPSFEPSTLNIELTTMILATSVLTTSSPSLRELGTCLRRLIRPLIFEKLEKVHESSSRLELYQAVLLSLELDLWHNEEGCLYRAGKFTSIIATIVRGELMGRQPESIAPLSPTDNVERVTEKWIAWVRAESYRRLMMRFCVYDNQLSMTMGVRPTISLSDYRHAVPQPKDLWSARTATDWSHKYMAQQQSYVPRVIDLFVSMPNIPLIAGFLDSGLAMKVSFHLLGGLITEHHLSTLTPFSMTQTRSGDERGLESTQSRKRELETAITSFHHVFSANIRASSIEGLIVSYLSMTLSACIKRVETLAGKAGEQESRDAYQDMQGWADTPDARKAIWHAGQVLRHFKSLDRLTSFQIIMVYHAGLVLYAYSVLSCVSGRPTAAKSDSICYLNEGPSTQLEEFIRDGSFEPMLRSDSRDTHRASVPLVATKDAVEIISEIILNRAWNCEGLSPRLVKGLAKLLQDLACVS